MWNRMLYIIIAWSKLLRQQQCSPPDIYCGRHQLTQWKENLLTNITLHSWEQNECLVTIQSRSPKNLLNYADMWSVLWFPIWHHCGRIEVWHQCPHLFKSSSSLLQKAVHQVWSILQNSRHLNKARIWFIEQARWSWLDQAQHCQSLEAYTNSRFNYPGNKIYILLT